MSERRLIIIGAGGHGREVLDIVEALGESTRFDGFVDDVAPSGEAEARLRRRDALVLGDIRSMNGAAYDFVIGIGTSAVRRSISDTVASIAPDSQAIVLTHPSAVVGSDNRFEAGVVVGAHSTVTTNVRIGRHSHVNVGCAVQHDTVIGEFVTVSPGVFINGDVVIGDDTFIGTGAIITRGCTIGTGAIIGAGAVVLHDVAADARVIGIPARVHDR